MIAALPDYVTVIPDATRLGVVTLVARDLSRMVAFYRDRLGLHVHRETPEFAALGAGGEDLLHLIGNPSAPRPDRVAGLYHFCLKVDDRRDFARWLAHLVATNTPLAGLVDHRFAEAIYLDDPEGNGVELNWDRPRSEWPDPSVVIRLGNAALDIEGLQTLLDGAAPWHGVPADTSVGHIHLHVGDLAAAERFYTEVIGFGRVMEMPRQAVFTSAGGYHHHVATNVWKGRGIPAAPEGAVGLASYTITVPTAADRDAIVGRARTAGVAVGGTADAPFVRDPSGNGIALTVEPA
jgi:catechol 2,3-dioxygenase